MARRNQNPRKASMRKLMRDFLKEHDISVKDGEDINSLMRDMMSALIEGTLDGELDDTLGYDRYEISNYARFPEYRCKQNLAYWQRQEYLGLGLGAALSSHRDLTRHFNGEIELPAWRKAVALTMIMFLVTSAVSICGTIGFISLGVPNLSRIMCKSTDIRKHYLLSSAMGVGLLLITYIVVEYVNFGIYLPVSATMAIIALPLTVFLFTRNNK